MGQELQMRRRSGYAALPGSEGDRAGSSSEQHAGSAGLFNSLYSALGGWLIEPSAAQDGLDSTALEAPQSLSQVIEQMGNWALRGVMFNMCMPVTTGSSARHTPLASRSDTPDDAAGAGAAAAAHAVKALVSSSRADRHSDSSVLDAAGGCAGSDVIKRPAQQNSEKQQTAGIGAKPLSHSNSSANLTDQQQPGPPTASPAGQPATADANTSISTSSISRTDRDTGGGSNTGAVAAAAAAAVLQQEVGRLRQEVSCLRTTLGTLYVTCSHLRQENQRLRSADEGGEELLSGALQQLLGQKSELQQEVARLRSQNQALQELLDYTAAAAAGPAASTAADTAPWGCCESSSAQRSGDAQYAAEYAAAGFSAAQHTSCDGGPAAYTAAQACNSSSGAGSAVEDHFWYPQQQQEAAGQHDRGYWLVTPAGSPGASPSSVCATACHSPMAGNRCAEPCPSASQPAAGCEVDCSCPDAGRSKAPADRQLQQSLQVAANSEDAAAAVAGVAVDLLQQAVVAGNGRTIAAEAASVLHQSLVADLVAAAIAEAAVTIDAEYEAALAAAAARGEILEDMLDAELCQGGWGDAGDGDWASAVDMVEVGAAATTASQGAGQPSVK